MRYVSLAIIGTLSLGMMLCAQTIHPARPTIPDESGEQLSQQSAARSSDATSPDARCPSELVDGTLASDAVLIARPKPKIHRFESDLIPAAAAQIGMVRSDAPVKMVRGRRKQVLQASAKHPVALDPIHEQGVDDFSAKVSPRSEFEVSEFEVSEFEVSEFEVSEVDSSGADTRSAASTIAATKIDLPSMPDLGVAGAVKVDIGAVEIARADLKPRTTTTAAPLLSQDRAATETRDRAARKRIRKFSPLGSSPTDVSLSVSRVIGRSKSPSSPEPKPHAELARLPEALPDLKMDQPALSIANAGRFEQWSADRYVNQAGLSEFDPAARGLVRPVGHRDSLTDLDPSNGVAELVVGTLPDSSRRVRLAANQLDSNPPQKRESIEAPANNQRPAEGARELLAAPRAAIPLKAAPTTDRASIQKTDDLVTLVATDAELRAVLRMIADHHHLNLVIGPEVAGPVTVSIRGARLEEILDAILGVAGFNWHLSGNLLYVTGAESATLDPKVQGRRLQVYPLNYVSSTDIEPVVAGLLSPVGKVFTSESDAVDQLRTQELLVVEDTEAAHQRISQYLAQVDVQPRQVLIEAHVLRIDLGDEERYGVNLRGLARVAGAKVILEGSNFADKEPEGPSMAFRIEGRDVTHLIEAIHANTNSRTLASPKVSVVNRQTAKVQIGQRLPYAVATTTQTATIQNVQFLDVGIVLEVTPVVTEDRNILMTVLPKVSGGKITDSGFPEEDTTQVSTTVLMPDGSGLVIGGLIREVDTDDRAEVPKLGKIPVVKYLFNKLNRENRRSELVIALVTHIMDDANPVRPKECIDLRDALPPHAASELRYTPEIRYSNQ